jgi:hypothetical protein
MMKKVIFLTLLFFTLNNVTNNSLAQTDKDLFYDQVEENLVSVEALSLYPEDTRKAILQAALHPEIIVKLENVQAQFRDRFISIIENLSRDEQQDIYDLARYNGLIDKLAEGRRRKSEEELTEILKNYPEEIHQTARETARKHFQIFNRISELNETAEKTFSSILNNYSEETRQAYRHLINFPEILEILSDNMRFTVTVGDLYKREPQWVEQRLDSLNLEAARKNAQETEAWKKQLEENPELLDEFTHSAEQYAQDKGFAEEEYRQQQAVMDPVFFHPFYSYSFWFGTPWWHPYTYWYRWPVWYDWGFFYGPGGGMIITGVPSFYYTYWYFHHPRHHVYYPRLSTTFVNHYENHPRSSTGVSAGLSTWINDNRNILPQNLLADDGNRTQRFREFGMFETEYRERVERRPGRRVTREEFLQRNSRRFQNLAEPGIRAEDLPQRLRDRPEIIEGEARRGFDRLPNGERTAPGVRER